jgi:nitroreductase
MIAICMARQAKPGKLMPLWEELAAVACAVQNMHLMAASLGVAGFWSSWHDLARDSPAMLEFLGLEHAKGDRCAVRVCAGNAAKAAGARAGLSAG